MTSFDSSSSSLSSDSTSNGSDSEYPRGNSRPDGGVPLYERRGRPTENIDINYSSTSGRSSMPVQLSPNQVLRQGIRIEDLNTVDRMMIDNFQKLYRTGMSIARNSSAAPRQASTTSMPNPNWSDNGGQDATAQFGIGMYSPQRDHI